MIPAFKASKVLMRSLKNLQPDIVHASLTLSPLDFALPEICEELNVSLYTPISNQDQKNYLNDLILSKFNFIIVSVLMLSCKCTPMTFYM